MRKETGTPKRLTVVPRPEAGRRGHPGIRSGSSTAKTMISISPTQKLGSEKPRIEPVMIALLPGAWGRSPA